LCRWVDEFLKSGGYLGLLERLKELLDMEWRCVALAHLVISPICFADAWLDVRAVRSSMTTRSCTRSCAASRRSR